MDPLDSSSVCLPKKTQLTSGLPTNMSSPRALAVHFTAGGRQLFVHGGSWKPSTETMATDEEVTSQGFLAKSCLLFGHVKVIWER